MDMNNPLWQLLFGAVLVGVTVIGSYFGLRPPPKGSPMDTLLAMLQKVLENKDAQIERQQNQFQSMVAPQPSVQAAPNIIQGGETVVGVKFRVQVLSQEESA